MKRLYTVTYEQKFGKDWLEYADTIVAKDAEHAIYRVRQEQKNMELDDLPCKGIRFINVACVGIIDY